MRQSTNNHLRSAHPRRFIPPLFGLLASASAFLVLSLSSAAQAPARAPASSASNPAAPLPNAPAPKTVVRHRSKAGECRVVPIGESAGYALLTLTGALDLSLAFPGEQLKPAVNANTMPVCPPVPIINWFARFLNGPQVKPLTPPEKARLAVKNVLDPFNAVTILGQSAFAVGLDSHSPYGPGMLGYAKNVGVSYAEDITGEFFGTFLIPSVMHQDPHYHREPHATIPHRIGHAILQVVWTQGDNGRGMPNYANIIGFPIDAEISNLYVPGERTNRPSTAERYATGLAIAPTDNFITEFLPDVARRIHVRIVLVQRIIDQVARTEPAGSP